MPIRGHKRDFGTFSEQEPRDTIITDTDHDASDIIWSTQRDGKRRRIEYNVEASELDTELVVSLLFLP